jgi:hypothetical protein
MNCCPESFSGAIIADLRGLNEVIPTPIVIPSRLKTKNETIQEFKNKKLPTWHIRRRDAFERMKRRNTSSG